MVWQFVRVRGCRGTQSKNLSWTYCMATLSREEGSFDCVRESGALRSDVMKRKGAYLPGER